MVNERIYDDSIFLPIGSPLPEPHTTGALLGRLKLVRADDETQRAAIRMWLTANEPSPAIVRSLHRRAFGDLLADYRTEGTAGCPP
ncbi:hypothetical protein [Prescottella equi]